MEQIKPAVIAAIWLLAFAAPSSAQVSYQPRYTLLDVIVFGDFLAVDMSAYSPEVRLPLEQHIARSKAYRPRPRPANLSGLLKMVYDAREVYERRLVAAANQPSVEKLAQQYVDKLRPCYEWEGYHDCPEREAKFAEQYVAVNPNSPARELLVLLAAHRWLCAAEGYDYEEKPQDATRTRRASDASLALALKAQSVLMRTAAQELKARARCHPAGV